MAKKHFSEETRRKIAAKAREREERKRQARSGAIVVRNPNTPPPGDDSKFSPRTKKTIRDLFTVRIRAEASVEDLKIKAKTFKEGSDIAVQQRDTFVREGLDKNTLDDNFDKIRELTTRRDKCLDGLKKTRNKIKAQKAIATEALMKMDRAIAGESAEGTLYEENVEDKK